MGLVCSPNGLCIQSCTPQCQGKECGDDKCGGSCGTCPPGKSCDQFGLCKGCIPDCAGKECGDNGCGGSCGSCGIGLACNEGLCGEPCEPNCTNKECGDNGCNGTCGQCDPGLVCAEGLCVEEGGSVDAGDPSSPDLWEEDVTQQKDAPWNEPSEIETDGSSIPGNDCPEGKILRYGKCVPKDEVDPGDDTGKGDPSSGCSAGTSSSPAGLVLMLMLAAGMWITRRRQVRAWGV